ncbi:MAG: hypothetical protein M1376_19215 [Planctomycetes bacterium]|nr:hypothetical protein [Planctomycetota bacterium]
MKYWMFCTVLVSVVIVGVTGCSSWGRKGERGEGKEGAEQKVSLTQVPALVRATIEKQTAGGEIKSIEKEEKDGQVIYDVEATVQGRDVEYDIAADGTVLTNEQGVPFASLPPTVRSAAEKYFGSAADLKAGVETEGDKTFYEVEGKKGRTLVTLRLTNTGQIVEEEKEK